MLNAVVHLEKKKFWPTLVVPLILGAGWQCGLWSLLSVICLVM